MSSYYYHIFFKKSKTVCNAISFCLWTETVTARDALKKGKKNDANRSTSKDPPKSAGPKRPPARYIYICII